MRDGSSGDPCTPSIPGDSALGTTGAAHAPQFHIRTFSSPRCTADRCARTHLTHEPAQTCGGRPHDPASCHTSRRMWTGVGWTRLPECRHVTSGGSPRRGDAGAATSNSHHPACPFSWPCTSRSRPSCTRTRRSQPHSEAPRAVASGPTHCRMLAARPPRGWHGRHRPRSSHLPPSGSVS